MSKKFNGHRCERRNLTDLVLGTGPTGKKRAKPKAKKRSKNFTTEPAVNKMEGGGPASPVDSLLGVLGRKGMPGYTSSGNMPVDTQALLGYVNAAQGRITGGMSPRDAANTNAYLMEQQMNHGLPATAQALYGTERKMVTGGPLGKEVIAGAMPMAPSSTAVAMPGMPQPVLDQSMIPDVTMRVRSAEEEAIYRDQLRRYLNTKRLATEQRYGGVLNTPQKFDLGGIPTNVTGLFDAVNQYAAEQGIDMNLDGGQKVLGQLGLSSNKNMLTNLAAGEAPSAVADHMKKGGLKNLAGSALGTLGSYFSQQSFDPAAAADPYRFYAQDNTSATIGDALTGASQGMKFGPFGALVGAGANVVFGRDKRAGAKDAFIAQNEDARLLQGETNSQQAADNSAMAYGSYNEQGNFMNPFGAMMRIGGKTDILDDPHNPYSRGYDPSLVTQSGSIRQVNDLLSGLTGYGRPIDSPVPGGMGMRNAAGYQAYGDVMRLDRKRAEAQQQQEQELQMMEYMRESYPGVNRLAMGGRPDYETEKNEVILASPGDKPIAITGNSYKQLSNNLFKGRGPSHEQGGIPTKGATEPFVDSGGNYQDSPYVFSDAYKIDPTEILSMLS